MLLQMALFHLFLIVEKCSIMCVYIYVYIYIYIHIYVYICIHTHTYIYVHIHTYIRIYTYTYTHTPHLLYPFIKLFFEASCIFHTAWYIAGDYGISYGAAQWLWSTPLPCQHSCLLSSVFSTAVATNWWPTDNRWYVAQRLYNVCSGSLRIILFLLVVNILIARDKMQTSRILASLRKLKSWKLSINSHMAKVY